MVHLLAIKIFLMYQKLHDCTYNHSSFSYIWKDSDLDTEEEKRWTWVLVLLTLWPQYQAVKLVRRIWKLKRPEVYRDNIDLKRQKEVSL